MELKDRDRLDLFAAAALAGGLQQHEVSNDEAVRKRPDWWYDPSGIAARAFDIAQAMMDESKRRGRAYRDAAEVAADHLARFRAEREVERKAVSRIGQTVRRQAPTTPKGDGDSTPG